MELLIPGLALVALMVWASTRIKRSAALAFEPEVIDNEFFTIEKPNGFLHVLNDNSGLAFRSYTKEFGKVGKKDVRQATAEVQIFQQKALGERKKEIEKAEKSISSTPYADSGEKALRLETESSVNGGDFRNLYRIVTRGPNLIEMKVSILLSHVDENAERAEQMINGFSVK